LPDSYGWMRLIMAPASMLAFLLAVWGGDLWMQLRRLPQTAGGRAALGVLIIVPVLGVGLVGKRVAAVHHARGGLAPQPKGALSADYPRLNKPAAALGLVNQYGETIELADLQARETIVTFAYAHCETICPMIVQTARKAAAYLDRRPVNLVMITLDPWRDTPSKLPRLMERWALDQFEHAHLLSGDVDAVQAVLEGYNIPTQRDSQNGEIAHPAIAYVLDREGRIAYSFQNPPADWLAAAVHRIRSEPATPSGAS